MGGNGGYGTVRMDRREFVRGAAAAAALAVVGAPACGERKQPRLPRRLLGRTGCEVSVFGLGGASLKGPVSSGDRDSALAIIERALNMGVNFFDTASSYGTSEAYLGQALVCRRRDVFIASKTDCRTRDGAWRDLEQSLRRLRTDYLDCWQAHRVSLHARDTEPAFAPGGVIQAFEEAREQKVVRFTGITGHHDPLVLADWIRRWSFDTVMAPFNCCDVHHGRSFIRTLLPLVAERGMGAVAMKVHASGRLLRPAAGLGVSTAVEYALSLPGVSSCLIGCDSTAMLDENVAAAAQAACSPLSAGQMRAVELVSGAFWQACGAGFYRTWR